MDTYYNLEDLEKFASIDEKSPGLTEKLFGCYNPVFEEGVLIARGKPLIVLVVAHTVQCPYCIDTYTNDYLNEDISQDQMLEAIHVTTVIRGGMSLVHGVQIKNITKKSKL